MMATTPIRMSSADSCEYPLCIQAFGPRDGLTGYAKEMNVTSSIMMVTSSETMTLQKMKELKVSSTFDCDNSINFFVGRCSAMAICSTAFSMSLVVAYTSCTFFLNLLNACSRVAVGGSGSNFLSLCSLCIMLSVSSDIFGTRGVPDWGVFVNAWGVRLYKCILSYFLWGMFLMCLRRVPSGLLR